jgi:hypothetical protein
MEAARQDMEQEATDELVGGLLPVCAVATIILVAEGDAALVEGDQTAVRDGDPVGVAGEIGQHRFRPGEGRLGLDHPALLPDRLQMVQECASVCQVRHGAEQGESSGLVQRDQPGQEQAADQLAEHPHRKQEGGAR